MAVRVEISNSSKGFALAHGMKVFLDSGEEIKDITKFGMPTMGVDDIMEVTLTIPVTDIKFINSSYDNELKEAKECIAYSESVVKGLLEDIDILTLQAVKRSTV